MRICRVATRFPSFERQDQVKRHVTSVCNAELSFSSCMSLHRACKPFAAIDWLTRDFWFVLGVRSQSLVFCNRVLCQCAHITTWTRPVEPFSPSLMSFAACDMRMNMHTRHLPCPMRQLTGTSSPCYHHLGTLPLAMLVTAAILVIPVTPKSSN